jgi:hypothetical protein
VVGFEIDTQLKFSLSVLFRLRSIQASDYTSDEDTPPASFLSKVRGAIQEEV